MELVHTLLFFLREEAVGEDMTMIENCLKSLEKSTYHTVIVYNQGFWDNDRLRDYLDSYRLNCVVLGDGTNDGIVVGRQRCFAYIWENFPSAFYTSELHLDMVFTFNWEDPLVEYLVMNDEPLICCGIVDKKGALQYLDESWQAVPDGDMESMDAYLAGMRRDAIVHGFTHPCIHRLDILKEVGGYDSGFLTGKQAFEDDSLLLGYFYYYGTKAKWKPKVNFQSVVYHEIGGQRFGLGDNVMENFSGLSSQYGAMGFKHLAELHRNSWNVSFFAQQYRMMRSLASG